MQARSSSIGDWQLNPREWVVVIPSIRQVNVDNIRNVPEDVLVVVIDDSNGRVRRNRENMLILTYSDQKRMLGRKWDLVPHKTAACRNFGFYYIWSETKFKYVITLDDDCETQANHVGILDGLLGKNVRLPTIVSRDHWSWFNTIDLLLPGRRVYARGFPLWERGSTCAISKSLGRVVCNMGLWTGHLDVDAIDRFTSKKHEVIYESCAIKKPHFRVGSRTRLTHFPLCAMNVAFVREIIPAMTQVPMNDVLVDDYRVWRYDDIWSGYVLQELAYKKGDALTVGKPIVYHRKVGEIKKEIRGEYPGHLLSSFFYWLVDEAARKVSQSNYAKMYCDLLELSVFEIASQRGVPQVFRRYLKGLLTRMHEWSLLFR